MNNCSLTMEQVFSFTRHAQKIVYNLIINVNLVVHQLCCCILRWSTQNPSINVENSYFLIYDKTINDLKKNLNSIKAKCCLWNGDANKFSKLKFGVFLCVENMLKRTMKNINKRFKMINDFSWRILSGLSEIKIQ